MCRAASCCQKLLHYGNAIYAISVGLLGFLRLFSPFGKLALGNFFFFKSTENISASTGLIFTIFSPYERYLREFSRSGHLFPIPQGTWAWQPILGKICKMTFIQHAGVSKRIRLSQFHCVTRGPPLQSPPPPRPRVYPPNRNVTL